jgi:GT2 family glycosyltransferase
MKEPAVSVLVTVYNRADMLEETVASIQASTFKDLEIILVDDASTDDSWEICEKLAAGDSRIRAFRNEFNIGDYPNRNRAAALARGKYLKYLDADDLIYPHSIELMKNAMERFPDSAIGLSAGVFHLSYLFPREIHPEEFFKAFAIGQSPIQVGPSGAIINRYRFESLGGFSGTRFIGDTELFHKFAEHGPVVLLPPALVWWRRHEGQQSRLEKKNMEIKRLRYQLNLDILERTKHLQRAEIDSAQRRLHVEHARWLIALAWKGQVDMALGYFRKSGISFPDVWRALVSYAPRVR